jgi:mannose-1-phosphate guanylyltransferase
MVLGFGTRLRPLTLTVPKPLVEFANKPMILHQIEALVKVGVQEIVLAVNYRADIMEKNIRDFEKQYGIRLTLSVEQEPMGTAGPLALAKELLSEDNEPFFVLNSDIICEFPFKEMLMFHKIHGHEGTIVVKKVSEPSKYGVVVCKPNTSQVERFVEKPGEFISNKINAGLYLLSPAVLNRIELRPTSIEKEVFPQMAKDSELDAMELEGYWMDVGQPRDFLVGMGLYLENLASRFPEKLLKESYIQGHVLVDPTAKIGKDCKIGPNVTIGAHVIIEDGVRLVDATIMAGATIKANALISKTIVGWNCKVGKWVGLMIKRIRRLSYIDILILRSILVTIGRCDGSRRRCDS